MSNSKPGKLRFPLNQYSWGFDRIVGALANLGYKVSDQTVGNVLARNGLPPRGGRESNGNWAEFIRSHEEVIAAADFFTAEVFTQGGLITYYVLFFLIIGPRKVHIAGVTPNPDESWMKQVARNVTMADDGFLSGCRYLIIDRDAKFSAAFRMIIKSTGIKPIRLPPRSPNLNAFAERWVRSVQEECLSKMIFFGERSLRQVLTEYLAHFHSERNHQGKGNAILFPADGVDSAEQSGPIECRQRLGGLLKYYYRKAA